MTSTTSTASPAASLFTPPARDSSFVPPSNGIVGGYTGDNANILRAMTAFSAIAFYNAFELILLVFLRFKKRVGLYFWSMIVTSVSIIVYQFGAWGKMINLSQITVFSLTFMNVGWIFMVTGQSIVLYSRLHLITQSRTILRSVLFLILFNAVVLYVPTSCLNYGAILHPTKKVYVNGYEIMERIQMTIFTLQEFAISVIYLVEIGKFLRITYEDQTRKLMYELLIVNIALIMLDVVLLSVEYENLYQIETTLKGMVYSIKLKLELGVLSKLVKVVTARQESYRMTGPDQDTDLKRFTSAAIDRDILDPSRTNASGERTSDEDSGSYPNDSNSKITDFAGMNKAGGPLTAPTDEESAAAQAQLREAARKSSDTSSLDRLYPGKLETSTTPDPEAQSWPLKT